MQTFLIICCVRKLRTQ